MPHQVIEYIFWFCIASVMYSYIIYPGILSLLARLFGSDVKKDLTYAPSVGILVPVYNEEKVIEKKIQSIFAIDYPADKISIWFGSDMSTDRTNELVEKHPDNRVHLWKAPRRGGKTEILNHLAPQIEAEIILFTDANTMHAPDCLKHLIPPFADEQVGGVAGHIDHALKTSEEMEERLYRSFESTQKFHESLLHSTISAFGGFYALRKKLFKPIPPNAYSNDDVLIPMNTIRQNHRMIFVPEALSFEDMTENFAIEFKRRLRIGAGNFQAFFWLLDFLNPFKGWPWFCYMSHKVSRWFSPLFLICALAGCIYLSLTGVAPLYTILMYGAAGLLLFAASSRIVPTRLTNALFYFFSMNVAVSLGFFRYLRGIKSAAWSRTTREEEERKN